MLEPVPTRLRPSHPDGCPVMRPLPLLLTAATLLNAGLANAADPLHQRIDQLILAGAKGAPISPRSDDAEFLRRVSLDLAGTIPSAGAARAFLASKDAGKRTKLIDE